MSQPISRTKIAQAFRHLWQKQKWYRNQVKAQVGVNSFSRNGAGVNTVGGMTLAMFENAFGHTSARVASQFIKSVSDKDYGDHLMIYMAPPRMDEDPTMASGSQYRHVADTSLERKSIAFISHLDTVYPSEIEALHGHVWTPYSDSSGYIRGPGTMDIKCGTACIAMTLEALNVIDPEVFDSTGFHIWLNAAEEPMAPDFKAVIQQRVEQHTSSFREELLAGLVFESAPMTLHPKLRKLLRAKCGEQIDASTIEYEVYSDEPDDDLHVHAENSGMSSAQFEELLSGLLWPEISDNESDASQSDASHASPIGSMAFVCQRKGMAVWNVKIRGRPSHAGNQHSFGRSAVLAAADFIQATELATDYGRGLTFNVGSISGGTVHNVVPEMAELTIEMRADNLAAFAAGVRFVRSVALTYEHRSRGPDSDEPTQALSGRIASWASTGLDEISDAKEESHEHIESEPTVVGPVVTLTERAFVPPWRENEETKTLYRAWAETGRDLGFDVWEQRRGGLSDGNNLWDWIPTLDGLGPHGGGQHIPIEDTNTNTHAEWVDWPSLIPKAVTNAITIRNLVRNTESER